MQLFLDTNIYLGFYKLSGDDLEELRKLAVTVRTGETALYLTDQVVNEFQRNRAPAITDSLRHVEAAQIPKGYPRLLTNFDGYAGLRATTEQFELQRAELLREAYEAAAAEELHADLLIQELFRLAKRVALSEALWSAAERRHLLGNPPGKKDSMGDAINWESLIESVPDGEALEFVTADTDYASKLDPARFNEFLAAEWTERKRSTVSSYGTLSALFRVKYPDIKLAAELEKGLAIDELITSANFRSTHISIQKLAPYPDFTRAEAETLVEAAVTNSQIRQLLQDDDVRRFYTDLLERFADGLPEVYVEAVRQKMRDPESEVD